MFLGGIQITVILILLSKTRMCRKKNSGCRIVMTGTIESISFIVLSLLFVSEHTPPATSKLKYYTTLTAVFDQKYFQCFKSLDFTVQGYDFH